MTLQERVTPWCHPSSTFCISLLYGLNATNGLLDLLQGEFTLIYNLWVPLFHIPYL